MFDRVKAKNFLLLLDDILRKCHIPFFLVQGTALGAYRDNGFTPSEEDIDIGILSEYLEVRVGKICKMLIDNNIEVITLHRHQPFGFCHTIVAYTDGAKADIVGFHSHTTKFGTRVRYACSPLDPVEVLVPYAIVHDAGILENYQEVTLFGRVFNVPSPIETYLEREYGPDWRTPKVDHISRTRVYNFLREINSLR